MPPPAAECPVSRARRSAVRRLRDGLLVLGLAAHLAGGLAGACARRTPTTPKPVLVDLSQSDVATLRLLPGVGIRRAYAIVDDRLANGPLRSFDELERIPGFGPRTVARLRACRALRITFGAADVPQGSAGRMPP